MACNNQSSLFGSSDKYIKFLNGDLVAIEGTNTVDKQILNSLRIPYAQLLRGRVVLKAGQVDYLLNHLGLGDNATFLSIAATYDPKSKIEEDNYVQYNYSDDLIQNHYFAQLMILTGNSTHRIPQLYLTNPNATYNVTLDVMVAVIDDVYTYFNDIINQSGMSFTGLELMDIHSYVVGESIVINDKTPKPLVYFRIVNISSIEKNGLILTIDDTSKGTILLKFKTETDANQAFSLLNYVLENPNVDIDSVISDNMFDTEAPVITFLTKVGGSGDYIYDFNGATGSLPDTTIGNTFSTSISLMTFGVGGVLDKNNLLNLLVYSVNDNRDGLISVTGSNLIISGTSGTTYSSITSVGDYSIGFNVSDIAENTTSGIVLNLTITDVILP
jgi:hypothetical protein